MIALRAAEFKHAQFCWEMIEKCWEVSGRVWEISGRVGKFGVVLVLKQDCGEKLTGWGEAGQYGPPEPVASAIEHVLGPRVVGQKILPTKVQSYLILSCLMRP